MEDIEKIENTIALKYQTIQEIKMLINKIEESSSKDIRFRIETKHWYGFGLEPHLIKEKDIINISKNSMITILNETIQKERERIDKLTDMEIETLKKNECNHNIDNGCIKKEEIKGWQPIEEYFKVNYDWVLIKYYEKGTDYECVPIVAEFNKRDNKWHIADEEYSSLADLFEVRYFFDMQKII